MRRFLVLALTMALGLTALAAAPAVATSQGDEDCTRTEARKGECVMAEKVKDRGDRDRGDRERGDRRERDDRDDRDRDDRRERGDRHDRDDRDDSKHRRTRNRNDDFGRWFRWWFWNDGWNDSCECLDRREERWLLRLANDPSRRDARRIVRYLQREDCLTDNEAWRLRRAARTLDEADLRRIIRRAADCNDDCDDWYHLERKDIRRLDRHTGLNQRTIRQILGYGNGRDCVDRDRIRRLDRRAGDLDYQDIIDYLGVRGRR